MRIETERGTATIHSASNRSPHWPPEPGQWVYVTCIAKSWADWKQVSDFPPEQQEGVMGCYHILVHEARDRRFSKFYSKIVDKLSDSDLKTLYGDLLAYEKMTGGHANELVFIIVHYEFAMRFGGSQWDNEISCYEAMERRRENWKAYERSNIYF